jgi:hypothetical protein
MKIGKEVTELFMKNLSRFSLHDKELLHAPLKGVSGNKFPWQVI